MTEFVDLKALLNRESEQVEWKEGVADAQDVAKTLVAFANDWQNLGGGYVVCGAREEKDEFGFPRVSMMGLPAARLKEIEGRVVALCRDNADPPIAPLVEEKLTDNPERRVLIFIQPRSQRAHQFRLRDGNTEYPIRVSRNTMKAQNGLLRELLVRKGDLPPWDRRPCANATVADLDLLALRDALQRMGVYQAATSIDEYLTPDKALSALVPSLCVSEGLTNTVRPRNFAMLLFGRNVQTFIPGAVSLFSIYPGTDRSETHAERHELTGTLIDQARRLIELLDVQSYVAFDKADTGLPNALKYPKRALHEAVVNALVHRNYETTDPARVTVFSDRVEIVSPGSLPAGVDPVEFQLGRSLPVWRNQSLAWFLSRLQLAQSEGQGIPTIIRSMREEGCPPPTFEINEARLTCRLPAHPRHGLARDHRAIEESLSLGDFGRARTLVTELLGRDRTNARTLQLFAEVHRVAADLDPVRQVVRELMNAPVALPASALVQLADALSQGKAPIDQEMARSLYVTASRSQAEAREIRQIGLGLNRGNEFREAADFLTRQFENHPALKSDPWVLRIRADAFIGQARQCLSTARQRDLPAPVKKRAWDDCRRFCALARADAERALMGSPERTIREQLQQTLAYITELEAKAKPKRR